MMTLWTRHMLWDSKRYQRGTNIIIQNYWVLFFFFFELTSNTTQPMSELESQSVTLRPVAHRQSFRLGAKPLETHGQIFFFQLNT
jgi:hypothetical protein